MLTTEKLTIEKVTGCEVCGPGWAVIRGNEVFPGWSRNAAENMAANGLRGYRACVGCALERRRQRYGAKEGAPDAA